MQSLERRDSKVPFLCASSIMSNTAVVLDTQRVFNRWYSSALLLSRMPNLTQ